MATYQLLNYRLSSSPSFALIGHAFPPRLFGNKNIKKVQLFSDSCLGQTKNSSILVALGVFAQKHNLEIVHTFPVRGHSYMPADRAFGSVEKNYDALSPFSCLRNISDIFLLLVKYRLTCMAKIDKPSISKKLLNLI